MRLNPPPNHIFVNINKQQQYLFIRHICLYRIWAIAFATGLLCSSIESTIDAAKITLGTFCPQAEPRSGTALASMTAWPSPRGRQ